MLGTREITGSEGYAAGVPAEAHFGLGSASVVDVRVELPDGEVIELTSVRATGIYVCPQGADERSRRNPHAKVVARAGCRESWGRQEGRRVHAGRNEGS